MTASEALQEIYNILGPGVPCCLTCDGCRYEMERAIEIARVALGLPKPDTGTQVAIGTAS